ncbi:MAG: hypothetical protein ACHQQS_06580 [Thermoanaerobaculales bacterium]
MGYFHDPLMVDKLVLMREAARQAALAFDGATNKGRAPRDGLRWVTQGLEGVFRQFYDSAARRGAPAADRLAYIHDALEAGNVPDVPDARQLERYLSGK